MGWMCSPPRLLLSGVSHRSSRLYDPVKHGMDVLASALRLATKFNHQELRAFTIQNIELEALRRRTIVELTHEIDSPDWREKALTHLTLHPDQIELEEAEILGIELVVEVVLRRERKLSQRALSPPQPIIIPSSRSSSPPLTEERSTMRPLENRGKLWASFLSRTQEKAKEVSIVGGGAKQKEKQQPGSSTTARRRRFVKSPKEAQII
ncbi:hypothetical protein RSAG8_08859, partial [Rhizoctonia solani AG-8 WAC10335]